MKKVLMVLIVILIVIGSFILFAFKFPMKKAVHSDFKTMKYERINDDDTTLICQYTSETGPTWVVIGKNNALFESLKPGEALENIIIKGSFLGEKMNWDLLMYQPPNKFILQGKVVGEEKYFDEGKYKVFEVKNWDIVYPVNRAGIGIISDDRLTLYDYFPIHK
ncbi:MAG TPA: hypothetical protein VF941_10285 [Clostridia bacterium]